MTTIHDRYNAQAIIPLNHRGAYAPPEGLGWDCTPFCSMGYQMTYWGYDNGSFKFRCPHMTGKVNCPMGTNWCSSSNYGAVVRKGYPIIQDIFLIHAEERPNGRNYIMNVPLLKGPLPG